MTSNTRKKVAILFSGRVSRYFHMFHVIKNSKHDINLFVHVNDDYDSNINFYKQFQENLYPWIKNFECEKFKLPDIFSEYPLLQHVKVSPVGIEHLVPFAERVVSMYNSDAKCFKMATEYADKHGFEYDVYLRIRPDVTPPSGELPVFDEDPNILHCISDFWGCKLLTTNEIGGAKYGDYYHCYGNVEWNGYPMIDSGCVYGSRKMMKLYCEKYERLLIDYEERKGIMFLLCEPAITTYVLEYKIPYKFIDYPYDHLPQNERHNGYDFNS